MKIITVVKKYIPRSVMQVYHKTLALVASYYYGRPSEKMIIIGVTGTNGKSSTVNIIGKLLEHEEAPVGFGTTANFKIADREWINETKMTMLGRFQLQKLLADMVTAGCRYAIIESSSQGIEQYRHLGINYDYLVFTNLTPEHIEAHGGFDNYKEAKGKLFAHLKRCGKKVLKGVEVPKKIIVNIDDAHADYFLSFWADEKIGYTLRDAHRADVDRMYTVKDVHLSSGGVSFNFEGTLFDSQLVGEFNVYNVAAALSIAYEENVDLVQLNQRLRGMQGIPGRMEVISEGQDFLVIVDYAPEPQSVQMLYDTIDFFDKNTLIHVLGSCGGGRDVARRPILGKMAGKKADYVIVTNEDPYDDNPMDIIFDVAQGAQEEGKAVDRDLFIIEDRRQAIQKAISLARKGDLVLITGKGCEQYIMSKDGSKIPHDDREVAREILRSQSYS